MFILSSNLLDDICRMSSQSVGLLLGKGLMESLRIVIDIDNPLYIPISSEREKPKLKNNLKFLYLIVLLFLFENVKQLQSNNFQRITFVEILQKKF